MSSLITWRYKEKKGIMNDQHIARGKEDGNLRMPELCQACELIIVERFTDRKQIKIVKVIEVIDSVCPFVILLFLMIINVSEDH